MLVVSFRGVLVALLLPLGLGIQGRTSLRAHKDLQPSSEPPSDEASEPPSEPASEPASDEDLMVPKYLDEDEVIERGSHCLNGDVPVYHHKEGTDTGKWVFWVSTNGICANGTTCVEALEKAAQGSASMSSKVMQAYGDFNNYHHVQINNCDNGFYMADRDDSENVDGQELYFQGGRMIKHIVDTLSKNYSMTDVLFAGGSGGGMSLHSGAYLIKSVMPDTVTRLGIVPMNGWYEEQQGYDIKNGFEYQQLSSSVSPDCANDYPGAEHTCMNPSIAYSYGDANIFVVQLFDYTFNNAHPEVLDPYMDCLYNADNCTDDKAVIVADFWNTFLSNFTQYPRYTASGQGGYFSTCTMHTFYNDEDSFYSFKSQGVTVGEAIWTWWEGLNEADPPAQWYLPCDMGNTAATLQCESTCESSSSEAEE